MTMSSGKDRLYVALHARGGRAVMPGLEDTYHWALMVGPKTETAGSRGLCFDAKEKMRVVGDPPAPRPVWEYEEKDTLTAPPQSMLLVRVVVAEVGDLDRLRSILRGVPVRPEGVEGWNCVAWVRDAVETALRDETAVAAAAAAPGGSPPSWDSIRDTAMWYVGQKKAAHRFDGQGDYDQSRTATWDLLERVELVP